MVTVGTSISLIVVGAALRYAVSWEVAVVDLKKIGLILVAAGILELVISLAWAFQLRLAPLGRRPAGGGQDEPGRPVARDLEWPTYAVPYELRPPYREPVSYDGEPAYSSRPGYRAATDNGAGMNAHGRFGGHPGGDHTADAPTGGWQHHMAEPLGRPEREF